MLNLHPYRRHKRCSAIRITTGQVVTNLSFCDAAPVERTIGITEPNSLFSGTVPVEHICIAESQSLLCAS